MKSTRYAGLDVNVFLFQHDMHHVFVNYIFYYFQGMLVQLTLETVRSVTSLRTFCSFPDP